MYNSRYEVRGHHSNTRRHGNFCRRKTPSVYQLSHAIKHSTKSRPSPSEPNPALPNHADCRRVLWVLFLLVALLGCCYQCGERLGHYLSDPSEVDTYYVRNRTITLPSFIVCPSMSSMHSPFNAKSRLPNINRYLFGLRSGIKTKITQNITAEYITAANTSMDELWDLAKVDVQAKAFTTDGTQGRQIKPADEGDSYMSETDTVFGKCLTFKAKPNIPLAGLQTFELGKLFGRNNLLPGFLIYWHPQEDLDLVKYAILHNSLFNALGTKWALYFRISQVIHRNTKLNPCEGDNNIVSKCLLECLERKVFSFLPKKCRLPYMQAKNFIPPCTNLRELNEVLSITVAVVETFLEDDCLCPRKCRKTIYSLQYASPVVTSENIQLVYWTLSLSDLEITVTHEKASYNGFALFSDLGGSIGLYLGISALQIYEVILGFFLKNVTKANGFHRNY